MKKITTYISKEIINQIDTLLKELTHEIQISNITETKKRRKLKAAIYAAIMLLARESRILHKNHLTMCIQKEKQCN